MPVYYVSLFTIKIDQTLETKWDNGNPIPANKYNKDPPDFTTNIITETNLF